MKLLRRKSYSNNITLCQLSSYRLAMHISERNTIDGKGMDLYRGGSRERDREAEKWRSTRRRHIVFGKQNKFKGLTHTN